MRTDRIAAALERLAAEERALLELSLWRVVSDDEIAGLLRVDPHDVRRRRHKGMKALCAELRLEGPEERRELMERLRSMPDEGWRAEPASERANGDGSEARGLRVRALLAALAVVTIAAASTLALSGGDGETRSAAHPRADVPAGKPARDSASPRAALEAVAGDSGEGTAQIVRHGSTPRLLLRMRGLAAPGPGEYVVWLYNAIDDARPIGGSKHGTFSLDAPLPRDASRFRAIDISLEAPDGIRAHGGDSVMRVPFPRLGGAR